jgi:hypothetical protein
VIDGQRIDRRFNLGDGMILVAALALWCIIDLRPWILCVSQALHRPSVSSIVPGVPPAAGSLAPIAPVGMAYVAWSFVPASLGMAFFAFVVLRLRGPRPAFRVVALQPGMVAFWAMIISGGLGALFDAVRHSEGPTLWWTTFVPACMSLPVAWGTLKLTKCWEPETGWIDRSGRVLGVCWWSATVIQTGLAIIVGL